MVAREVVPGEPGSSGSSDGRSLSDRYRTLFVLGRGGMGSVEAALEVTTDGEPRLVALKRLLPERRDARRVEMFLREAKLATMLDHQNVVRAYACGELGGELFLALEYVEGQPLSRVLAALRERGETLALPLAAHVIAEVCAGLHAAHELRGDGGQLLSVVHRDVSPQNVILGYDGSVRLLDFGIAKIEAESVTKTGEVKGKTAYMSPEQAMGDALDRRSDLFGVGALLFECIAGTRMWGDGTDMEVIRKLALESPPPLTKGSPDAPAWMSDLFARLVARAPEDRPATALVVAETLRTQDGAGDPARAREELGRLLVDRFEADARAERARLAAALDEAAPSQADALRESLLPLGESATMRAANDAHTGTGPREETGARRAFAPAARPGVPATAASRKTTGAGAIAVAIAVLGLMTWLIVRPPGANASAPAASASASAFTPSSAPAASASASAPAPASASAAPITPAAPPPAPPLPSRPAPSKPGAPRTLSSAVPRAPTASSTALAPLSEKPPASDVDDKPF